MDEAAVHIDVEGLYKIGVVVIVKDEDDAVLICFGKPELFVVRFIGEGALIKLGAILVFDDKLEPASFRIRVGHIKYDHVVLCAEIFYRDLFVLAIEGCGGLGMRRCKRQHQCDTRNKSAKDSVE